MSRAADKRGSDRKAGSLLPGSRKDGPEWNVSECKEATNFIMIMRQGIDPKALD